MLGQLHGSLVTLEVPLVVLNVSAGGFAIESAVSFPAGAGHQFRFTTAAGTTVVMTAVAIHSRPATSRNGLHHYVTGFEFVRDANDSTGASVDLLLEAATSALSFP